MKKYFIKIRYLIFAIIIYSLALFIEKNSIQTNSLQININTIEKILHKKERKLETVIDTFKLKIENKQYETSDSDELFFFNTDYSYLEKNGFIIIIYENDSLIFWSDNSIEIEHNFWESPFKNRVKDYQNSWYEIKTLRYKNFIIVGLIKLKDQFQNNNKYLVNEFHNDFNLPASINISRIPLTIGFNIKSKDGDYVFSLVPTNTFVTENLFSNTISVLYFLSIIFLLLFFNTIFEIVYKSKFSNYWLILFSGIILFIRFLTIILQFPISIYSLKFFDAQYFTNSFFALSIGDLLINTLLLVFFTYYFFSFIKKEKIFDFIQKKNIFMNIATAVIVLVVLYAIFFFIRNLLQSLIIDSNISFEIFNILSLNIFSLFAFVIFSLLLGVFIFIAFQFISILSNALKFKHFAISFLCSSIFPFAYFLFSNSDINIISIIFLFAIISSVIFIIYKKLEEKYYFYILTALFTALFSTFFIIKTINQKHDNEAKLSASELLEERDAIAELLLKDIKKSLINDETIKTYIQTPNYERTEEKIRKHLEQKYFKGYWNKYDINVTICSDVENTSYDKTLLSCQIKYQDLLKSRGRKIENSECYLIKNQNGSISYFLSESYRLHLFDTIAKLFLIIDPKLIPQDIGYPELLLDESVKLSRINAHSYAKYESHELITKSGDYKYPLNGEKIFQTEQEITFINNNQFRNVIYKIQEGNYIVLSNIKINAFDIIITFAYIFLIFNILLLAVIFTSRIPKINFHQTLQFRTKLLLSISLILTISFILVGSVTILYNTNQYKAKHNQAIAEKLQSVSINLEQKLNESDTLLYKWQETKKSELDYFLQDLSQVFFTDINLYNINGELIATSRPEIYKKQLISSRINPRALYELTINNKSEFIHKEKIGLLEFSSAYIPLENRQNEFLAYINIPYFTNPEILQKEISNLLVTVINLYVVLFLLSIFVAVFLSEQIIYPLRLLQYKFNKLEVGKEHEKIDYKRQDEIGDLVTEYNKMVDKLDDSISRLAKSERESAWRDMAKQIAHEIKNPLTPMKLSIQFLLRAWNNEDVDFDKRLKSVSQTLIDQIETLKKIATEFSTFAQMPKPKDEKINLITKINNIVQLYENTKDVKIVADLKEHSEVNIIADNKQISRVFINLIKNAIQAIPEGVKGKILITIEKDNENVKIIIEDNGSGISDEIKTKLFTPSFTTKSSGMGLGLPMVKNIVNNAKGKIWFKSEIGQETKFYLQFPIN